MNFQPDYRHIVNAAYNREAVRLPLYEHIVSADVIGKITGKVFSFLYDGDDNDIREYFRLYCQFFRDYGYDVIPLRMLYRPDHARCRRPWELPHHPCHPYPGRF